MVATCIVSRCGLFHHLHRGVAAVAGGEAGGLSRQGPALLLAPVAPVGVIRCEHACGSLGWPARDQGSSAHAWARWCGAGAAAKEGPVERKEAAGRTVAAAMDHTRIRGGAGEWRLQL
jgi:hypothetical protein